MVARGLIYAKLIAFPRHCLAVVSTVLEGRE